MIEKSDLISYATELKELNNKYKIDIMFEDQIKLQDNNIKIAKKRYRVGAFLIDFFIFWSIGMAVGVFFGEPMDEGEFGFSLTGLPALFMFACGFFFWPLSEAFWGQSIGKRLLDLKVVNDYCRPIGMGQAFGRFFLAFVDCMFCIGLFIASSNDKNKRIGDAVANTIVIRINSKN